jgi:hypothetical protein
LSTAADAAARAGAAALPQGVTAAQNAVVQYAAANKCDGTTVTIDPNTDIEFGSYDAASKTFTTLTGSARSNANAIRVSAHRTAAGGNAIPLLFARALGQSTCDIHTSSTAMLSTPCAGYVGLSLTRMFDVTRFDGYNSASGAYNVGTSTRATILSMKDLWLHDTCYVLGEAHWNTGGSLIKDSGATVNPGPLSQQSLSTVYAPVTLGSVTTVNNNSQITQYRSGTNFNMADNKPAATFPGGTYYFTQFDVGKNDVVTFTGPTTIYLNGGSAISGRVAHSSLRPYQLNIKVYGNNKIALQDGAMVYACIYDPGGSVHHHGGQSFGSVVSDLLCFRQTGQGHSDSSLGSISSVK